MQPVVPQEIDSFGNWFQQPEEKGLWNILAQKSRTLLILTYMQRWD